MSAKIFLVVMVLMAGFTLGAYAGETVATDYSVAKHWMNLPGKADRAVDVFYLYPTAWARMGENEPYVCAIDNPVMLMQAKLAFVRQAIAFEPVGNIYAPYYRQIDSAYRAALPVAEQEKLVGGIPVTDGVAAFDYYIKHYNNGRPFILAGHSQGSNVLIYLLSGYMKDHPDVYSRMIAAYVIGYSVTGDYLTKNPHLKFANGANDTGVIVSYNTEAPKVIGSNPVVLPGALVINPITWTRGEQLATAEQNLGSIILNAKGEVAVWDVKNFADAKVDLARGVLICSTVDVDKWSPGGKVFGKGVFHTFDYPFYYYNIRENAAGRTSNFLSKNPQR